MDAITAAQSDIARQPRRATDPLSGLPVLRFDGLDDWLSFQLLNDVRTVFVVAREDAHATSSFRAVLGDGEAADFTRGGDRVLYFHPHSGFAGEDAIVRVNGSPVKPTAARWPESLCLVTSVAAQRLRTSLIGSDRFVPDRNWHGDIGEVLVYNRKLNADEIAAVEAWLMAKWVLPAAALHTNFKLGDGDDAGALYRAPQVGLPYLKPYVCACRVRSCILQRCDLLGSSANRSNLQFAFAYNHQSDKHGK
jgi:hypothetical protein